jgi:hypothetical protein
LAHLGGRKSPPDPPCVVVVLAHGSLVDGDDGVWTGVVTGVWPGAKKCCRGSSENFVAEIVGE